MEAAIMATIQIQSKNINSAGDDREENVRRQEMEEVEVQEWKEKKREWADNESYCESKGQWDQQSYIEKGKSQERERKKEQQEVVRDRESEWEKELEKKSEEGASERGKVQGGRGKGGA